MKNYIMKNQLLHISIFFLLYAIPIFVVPKFISYAPVEIEGILHGFNKSGGNIYGNPIQIYGNPIQTFSDRNELMNDACHMWNSNPDISKIRFWMLHECKIHDDNKNLYNYFIIELILFLLLVLSICNFGKSSHWTINSILRICMIFWLGGIIYDICATINNESMDNFIYGKTYNMSGSTYISPHMNETLYKMKFNDQYSLLQNICDARKYFIDDHYWFMTFEYCTPNTGLGDYKILSIVFKSISLFLLFIANCLVAYRESPDKPDYDEIKEIL